MLSMPDCTDAHSSNPEEGVPRCGSIQRAGAEEALKFKWIESEKAGRDLGEAAIQCWIRRHWSRFVRDRWIEHLEGRVFWTELDQGDFGLLRQESAAAPLFAEIVRRLKAGGENLDILCWSHAKPLSKDDLGRVMRILEALDINGHRLECQIHSTVARAG
jgi:hypothetical protein